MSLSIMFKYFLFFLVVFVVCGQTQRANNGHVLKYDELFQNANQQQIQWLESQIVKSDRSAPPRLPCRRRMDHSGYAQPPQIVEDPSIFYKPATNNPEEIDTESNNYQLENEQLSYYNDPREENLKLPEESIHQKSVPVQPVVVEGTFLGYDESETSAVEENNKHTPQNQNDNIYEEHIARRSDKEVRPSKEQIIENCVKEAEKVVVKHKECDDPKEHVIEYFRRSMTGPNIADNPDKHIFDSPYNKPDIIINKNELSDISKGNDNGQLQRELEKNKNEPIETKFKPHINEPTDKNGDTDISKLFATPGRSLNSIEQQQLEPANGVPLSDFKSSRFSLLTNARICFACSSLSDPGCLTVSSKTTMKYCNKDNIACVTKTFSGVNSTILIRDCGNSCEYSNLPGLQRRYKSCSICHSDFCNAADSFGPGGFILPGLVILTIRHTFGLKFELL